MLFFFFFPITTKSLTSHTTHHNRKKHYTNEQTIKPRNKITFRGRDEVTGDEWETGRDPDGAKANPGPGATVSSGFGGLGLDGMVGRDDSAGESGTPPGEGNKGEISGDKVGEEDRGAPGSNAGAADILEN